MTGSPSSQPPEPQSTIIYLRNTDPDEGLARDIPKRTPLDWLKKPLTDAFAREYVASDAIYLDTIFKRLYCGSPTFRALLVLHPEVGSIPAMVNLLRNNAAAVNVAYNEVDINPETIGSDENGYVAVWAIAHEYRHVFQTQNKASIFDGGTFADVPSTSLTSFLALQRAMEADSNAFAATCLYEVLTSEGLTAEKIENAMKGTGLDLTMRTNACLSSQIEYDDNDGYAATMAFSSFFHRSNRHVLRRYDSKLMRNFELFSIVPSLDEKPGPDGLAARFNVMKTMPYMTPDNGAIERERYLEKIDFADLKNLPHFGIINRLHRRILHERFWSRHI